MKIAIISDIHANYEALNAVISDIKKNNIDKVICLGDIFGKGINAKKCVNLIKNNCEIVLRGNIEDRYTQDPELYKEDKVEYNRILFNQSLLNKKEIKYLASLPLTYEFYLSGNLVRVFHAHPESPYKTVNNYNIDFTKKYELFKPCQHTESQNIADLVIFGHVHYQFMEKIYNRTIINCGSVGCPGCLIFDEKINCSAREIRQAHYLILEGEEDCQETKDIGVTFRSVEYNREREFKQNKNNPEKDIYYDELFNAKYRGIEKAMQNLKDEGYKF